MYRPPLCVNLINEDILQNLTLLIIINRQITVHLNRKEMAWSVEIIFTGKVKRTCSTK